MCDREDPNDFNDRGRSLFAQFDGSRNNDWSYDDSSIIHDFSPPSLNEMENISIIPSLTDIIHVSPIFGTASHVHNVLLQDADIPNGLTSNAVLNREECHESSAELDAIGLVDREPSLVERDNVSLVGTQVRHESSAELDAMGLVDREPSLVERDNVSLVGTQVRHESSAELDPIGLVDREPSLDESDEASLIAVKTEVPEKAIERSALNAKKRHVGPVNKTSNKWEVSKSNFTGNAGDLQCVCVCR